MRSKVVIQHLIDRNIFNLYFTRNLSNPKMIKKSQIKRGVILDKLHRGAVYVCMGVTLYGTFLLGVRAYQYFTVVRPERQKTELKMIEEDSLDKAPEIKL